MLLIHIWDSCFSEMKCPSGSMWRGLSCTFSFQGACLLIQGKGFTIHSNKNKNPLYLCSQPYLLTSHVSCTLLLLWRLLLAGFSFKISSYSFAWCLYGSFIKCVFEGSCTCNTKGALLGHNTTFSCPEFMSCGNFYLSEGPWMVAKVSQHMVCVLTTRPSDHPSCFIC